MLFFKFIILVFRSLELPLLGIHSSRYESDIFPAKVLEDSLWHYLADGDKVEARFTQLSYRPDAEILTLPTHSLKERG